MIATGINLSTVAFSVSSETAPYTQYSHALGNDDINPSRYPRKECGDSHEATCERVHRRCTCTWDGQCKEDGQKFAKATQGGQNSCDKTTNTVPVVEAGLPYRHTHSRRRKYCTKIVTGYLCYTFRTAE